jgi:protein-L-isoaspartate(D-aspartate) O-methyltransferase
MSLFSRRDPAAQGAGMTSQRARDRLIERLVAEGIADRRVLDVMRSLPRHLFIDEALASRAYEDTALPIGQGQTISQPYVVARMTEALIESKMPRRVLEIGTGSGYQCAVLAQLVEQVFTVERIDELLRNARRRLRKLAIGNVRSRHADGRLGWPDEAPFDAIILTAAGTQL